MIDLLLRAPLEVVSVSGAAAGTTVDLQPDTGEVWLVAGAIGFHDDNGGARVCGWQLHDGVTELNYPGASIANGVYLPVYNWNSAGAANYSGSDFMLPLVLNQVTHLTFVGVAIGAGKKLYIRAAVYKFRGFGPWSNT